MPTREKPSLVGSTSSGASCEFPGRALPATIPFGIDELVRPSGSDTPTLAAAGFQMLLLISLVSFAGWRVEIVFDSMLGTTTFAAFACVSKGAA